MDNNATLVMDLRLHAFAVGTDHIVIIGRITLRNQDTFIFIRWTKNAFISCRGIAKNWFPNSIIFNQIIIRDRYFVQ